MDRREILAVSLVFLILIGLPAAALGYQYVIRPAASSTRIIEIRAAVPEAGGFQPDSIQVEAGETVTLRFSSVDVTHGVAIGPGLGIDLGHVDPGRVKEVTLRFDRAGTYTFYCNSWCSPDHWRMRGVVQIVDSNDPGLIPTAQRDPVVEALIAEGVDIDANVPQMDGDHAMTPEPALYVDPSAARGKTNLSSLDVPADLRDPAWRRTHTPLEALERLSASNPDRPQTDLVDAVASLWIADADSAALSTAETLYNKNCAACHGQTGSGDGPAAGDTTNQPAAFSDPSIMFERRGDVFYAKIRRGGMGTDMPNFGTLFTPEETWALVDYVWSLALPMGGEGSP